MTVALRAWCVSGFEDINVFDVSPVCNWLVTFGSAPALERRPHGPDRGGSCYCATAPGRPRGQPLVARGVRGRVCRRRPAGATDVV